MKNITYLFLIIPVLSFSQISVNSNNLPSIGDTIITAYDYGTYTPGNSGQNQTWNFSSASGNPEMILGFIDPATTPYSNSFPYSNICVQVDSAAYYYLNTSINGLSTLGIVDSGITYPFNNIILPTPLNYLDTITNSQILYQWDTVLNPPVPSFLVGVPGPYVIDSVKQIYGIEEKFIVDGWGEIIIPIDTFNSLRVFETNYEYDNTLYKLLDTITGLSQWVQDPNSSIYWTESRYMWVTNDTAIHWNLVTIETDSLGTAYGDISYYMGSSINNIVISPPIIELDKIGDVTCNSGSDGYIILDLIGTSYPFTFLWIGPNGFTSTNQDIYNLTAGIYEVTVNDANGNSSTEIFNINEPNSINAYITQLATNNLTVNVNGGTPPYSFFWNTGDTTQTITVTTNGNYLCAITDKLGCVYSVDFDLNNLPSNISNLSYNQKLIKIVNVLGKEVNPKKNHLLFYIYDNGETRRKITIE